MPVSLDDILRRTRLDLEARRPFAADVARRAAVAAEPPGFLAALQRPTVALIAEVKRRSPSAGVIRAELDPVAHATAYAGAGAAAISVLTDGPHFGGSLDDLAAVSASVPVPALRKDFVLDALQVDEARAAGASAVLLIVRALAPAELRRLLVATWEAGLEALVEVHTADEIAVALDAGARVVGVNSRDLDTFRIDTAAAWRLLDRIPAGVIAVAESGMASLADAEAAAAAGADAVLIGTALSSAADPSALARAVSGVARRGR
ncbi:MAG: indole-3-glycerol phosphate synthase TrpC [Gemmatimonadales bacterium]|nr:indole-3-glycerol phosphate synthase TrpC [Gemmatimonadales bacterium]